MLTQLLLKSLVLRQKFTLLLQTMAASANTQVKETLMRRAERRQIEANRGFESPTSPLRQAENDRGVGG
jgi:cob(I)alamin adenosyltransferase